MESGAQEDSTLTTTQANPRQRKERDDEESQDTVPRPKRAKYAAVACDACKKRKAKCVQEAASSTCRRCQSHELDCVFSQGLPSIPDMTVDDRFERIDSKVATLQRQMGTLQNEMIALRSSYAGKSADTAKFSYVSSHTSNNTSLGGHHGPQFVGRTRPAFSFDVATGSLKDMGVSTDIPAFSGRASPEPEIRSLTLQRTIPADLLSNCSEHELRRLVDVYREEVHPVYPFVHTPALLQQLDHLSEKSRGPTTTNVDRAFNTEEKMHVDYAMPLRMVLSIGKVIESLGVNDLSYQLAESVETEMSEMENGDATYSKVAVLTLLSLYYFHTDQELLAWRKIGVAARMSMELGCHRKESLINVFPDLEQRSQAVNLFWCVYVLDRRWSFGTSLPFAIQDADIDPELPEPDESAEYLRCMVKYGRICSKIWQAFPNYGSPTRGIPQDTASYLDFQIQKWLDSIPEHLQMGDLESASHSLGGNDGVSQRLRALLYLRGNHVRILINRHHVMSTPSARTDPIAAQRVVDCAKDSIRVLLELNETTNIYLRQQVAFNYFLISALAAIFLAVCHEPAMFGVQCKDSFFNAVDLIRVFSSRSHVSRRLWKSIKSLLPEAQKLGLDSVKYPGTRGTPLGAEQQNGGEVILHSNGAPFETASSDRNTNIANTLQQVTSGGPTMPALDFEQLTQDLNDWYDTFGLPDQDNYDSTMMANIPGSAVDYPGDHSEFSKLFMELI